MQTKEVAGACGIFAQNTTYTQNPEFAKNYVHTAWLHVHPNHGRRALATQAMVQMMRMANKFGYPSWFTLMDCPANTPPKGRGVYVDRLGMTELMTEEMKKIDNKFVHIMLELYNADPVNPNRELDLYWLHIPNLAEHLPMLDQVFADILPENQLHCDEVAALAFLRRQQQRF
jgi:hypothetical protein